MNYIFLDTNIFYNNWFLTNANFNLLFNFIENTDSTLLMSELVCEEVENIYQRECQSIINTLIQEKKKLEKMVQNPIDVDFETLMPEKYDFKSLLEEKCSNIEYIPYDAIEQNGVVKRALKNIRPFQDEEKGYRDTLIWLSFLRYLLAHNIQTADVYFITNNKDDFFNKKKDAFHQHLLDDIEQANLKCIIYPIDSLYGFITGYKIEFDDHGISKTKLYEDHLNEMDDEFEAELLFYINNLDQDKFKSIIERNRLRNFPYIQTIIDHKVELIEGVEDPEILHYKALTPKKTYVGFRYNLRICAIWFSIPTTEYYANKANIDKYYYEIKSDENLTTFCNYVRVFADTSFEYDMEAEELIGFDVNSIYFK